MSGLSEEEMIRIAIEQSQIEAERNENMEAFDKRMLEGAIKESLGGSPTDVGNLKYNYENNPTSTNPTVPEIPVDNNNNAVNTSSNVQIDAEMQRVLEESKREAEKEKRKKKELERKEQEQLKKALEASTRFEDTENRILEKSKQEAERNRIEGEKRRKELEAMEMREVEEKMIEEREAWKNRQKVEKEEKRRRERRRKKEKKKRSAPISDHHQGEEEFVEESLEMGLDDEENASDEVEIEEEDDEFLQNKKKKKKGIKKKLLGIFGKVTGITSNVEVKVKDEENNMKLIKEPDFEENEEEQYHF